MTLINNTVRMILVVCFVFAACLTASVALADALSVTVRITDVNAVEREIGTCAAGFQLRNDADAGSRLVPFRGGEATLTSRFSGLVAPGFYCEGVARPMPSAGVVVTAR